jgi:transcriptional regulator with XRE-family HTH domain
VPAPDAITFHVGDVVRKLRYARGWTALELARHAGVSNQTVANVERGLNYQADTMDRIAVALGHPNGFALGTLLTEWTMRGLVARGVARLEDVPPDVRAAADILSRLPEPHRSLVLAWIDVAAEQAGVMRQRKHRRDPGRD